MYQRRIGGGLHSTLRHDMLKMRGIAWPPGNRMNDNNLFVYSSPKAGSSIQLLQMLPHCPLSFADTISCVAHSSFSFLLDMMLFLIFLWRSGSFSDQSNMEMLIRRYNALKEAEPRLNDWGGYAMGSFRHRAFQQLPQPMSVGSMPRNRCPGNKAWRRASRPLARWGLLRFSARPSALGDGADGATERWGKPRT